MTARRLDVVRVDFPKSGKSIEVTEHTHTAPGDVTFAERISGLRASALEQLSEPVEQVLCQVRCDGCSAVADIDPAAPVLPDGWAETDAGDLCPACLPDV